MRWLLSVRRAVFGPDTVRLMVPNPPVYWPARFFSFETHLARDPGLVVDDIWGFVCQPDGMGAE